MFLFCGSCSQNWRFLIFCFGKKCFKFHCYFETGSMVSKKHFSVYASVINCKYLSSKLTAMHACFTPTAAILFPVVLVDQRPWLYFCTEQYNRTWAKSTNAKIENAVHTVYLVLWKFSLNGLSNKNEDMSLQQLISVSFTVEWFLYNHCHVDDL